MQQLEMDGPHRMTVREAPLLEPGVGEVRVKTVVASICGTDLSVYGGYICEDLPLPFVLGHEGCGVVDTVGPGIANLRPGDHVVLESNVGCGDCWYCTHGSHQLCEDSQQLGFVRPGVFAEYFIAPARYLYIIPDHVSFDEAVLTDIAANVLHAVQDAGVSFGDTVAVFGTGPAGFMAGQFARLCGASHVLLFGPIGNKVEMGRLMGIERMFDNTREEPDEFIKQQTDRETVDICIDCCGAELALTQMIRITRKQGHIELFGVFHQCPKVDLTEVVVKELSLSGSNAGPGCYDLALDFIAQGRLDVMPLITHRFSLHDAPQAFRLALADRTTYHKALLYPEGVPV